MNRSTRPARSLASTGFAALLLWTQCVFAQWSPPFPADFPDFFHDAKAAPPILQLDGTTILLGYTSRGFGVVRVLPDGTPDHGFGREGLVELVIWGGSAAAKAVLRQPDGRLVVAGNAKDLTIHPGRCDYVYQDCNYHMVLFRLGLDGRPDPTFNGYGRLVLRVGELRTPSSAPGNFDDGVESFVRTLVPGPNGAVDVVSEAGVIAARVQPDGSLDRDFRPGAPWPQAKEHDFVAAVPFYHPGLDQYFVTANLAEIAGLAREWSAVDGWFHVDPPGSTTMATAPPTVPVCRFWRRPEAGGGGHVHSANADECEALEADPDWILESREAFRVQLPDAATGSCPDGHPPVYRLWNGRADGGHLLSTRPSRDDRRVAQGYVAEGWGPDAVAMCAAP